MPPDDDDAELYLRRVNLNFIMFAQNASGNKDWVAMDSLPADCTTTITGSDIWGVNNLSFKGLKVVFITGGRTFSVAKTHDGKLLTWGTCFSGELGRRSYARLFSARAGFVNNIPTIRQVSCGNQHVIALSVSGECITWGNNRMGQLGYCTDSVWNKKPTKVGCIPGKCAKVAAGKMHTFCIDEIGQAWAWGCNSHGQLGREGKDLASCNQPQVVSLREKDSSVISVAGGGCHSALVTECGKVYTFGWGLYQQLGHGSDLRNSNKPKLVEELIGVGIFSPLAGSLSGIRVADCGEWHTAGVFFCIFETYT